MQELTSASFGIEAAAVTSPPAPPRLERGLPMSNQTLFETPIAHHRGQPRLHQGGEAPRAISSKACPDFVIVDEAHACVGSGAQGRKQQRYRNFCRRLAANARIGIYSSC